VTTLAVTDAQVGTEPVGGSRVVMYVLNDCRTDVRVLRHHHHLIKEFVDLGAHRGNHFESFLEMAGALVLVDPRRGRMHRSM